MLILINHIGYETNGPKQAVFQGPDTERCDSIRLLEHPTSREIISFEPVGAGKVPGWKDWMFWTCDFSSIMREGTYQLECVSSQGTFFSSPFLIQSQIYEREALSNVVAYFKS